MEAHRLKPVPQVMRPSKLKPNLVPMSLRHTNTKENTNRVFDPDLWHRL
jgi:hypothetical protein